MSDIVERARSYQLGNLALQSTWVGEMHELANEIERLRKQVTAYHRRLDEAGLISLAEMND